MSEQNPAVWQSLDDALARISTDLAVARERLRVMYCDRTSEVEERDNLRWTLGALVVEVLQSHHTEAMAIARDVQIEFESGCPMAKVAP